MNLVLPSAPTALVYGAPATTKFSSVLIDNDSPNLLVLSSLSVIVAVNCVCSVVPASDEDLNRKWTSPCPLPGADAITVLPSLPATILCPNSCSAVLASGERTNPVVYGSCFSYTRHSPELSASAKTLSPGCSMASSLSVY